MFNPDTLYTANLKKLQELNPRVHYAAKAWLDACWRKQLYFEITEAYRPQWRQSQLYQQGRNGKPGRIVTYTNSSLHTQRLAVDLYVKNCTYEEIESVARQFGITQPLKNVRLPDGSTFTDRPHFQFDQAIDAPKVDPEQARKQALEQANRSPEPRKGRIMKRLESLLHFPPIR